MRRRGTSAPRRDAGPRAGTLPLLAGALLLVALAGAAGCGAASLGRLPRTTAEYAKPDPLPDRAPPALLADIPADVPTLDLYVVDVGQGDALLLRSPGGHTILMDAGPVDGAGALARALSRSGVRRLDIFVTTHRHDDHIGGLPRLAGRYPPTVVVDPGYPVAGPVSAEYSATLVELGVRVVAAERGLTIVARAGDLWMCTAASEETPASLLVVATTGVQERALPADVACVDALPPAAPEESPALVLEFLLPTPPFIAGSRSDANANSTIVRMDYGGLCGVFAADAEADTERRLLETVPSEAIRCPLLKVAHHGSRFSSTDAFLDAVGASVALIPVGRFNRHGHPSPATIRKLHQRGVWTYRTDKMGSLHVRTDGQRLHVQVERTADFWRRTLRRTR